MLHNFCCAVDDVLMSSGHYLLCCFFADVVLRVHVCPNMPLGDLLFPCTPNFPCPLCHATLIRPKQHMFGHLRPLCTDTHGYDYDRVCLCFCVFVVCTARVRMPVFGLAGAYMLVFCAF